jgi:hypothetical protein
VIEKYFSIGMRYRWNPPAAIHGPYDGQIVDNRGATSDLRYDGLDGTIQNPQLMLTNVSTIGARVGMPIQHVWLDYVHGRTSRTPITAYDILTGWMSGCWVVRWSDRGVSYVGHVGTIVGNSAVNKQVKQTFADAMGNVVSGFNPAAAWNFGEIQTLAAKLATGRPPQIMALVTTAGKFYSVLMLDLGNNEWCSGGIKECRPASRDEIYLMLKKLDDG